MRSSIDVYTNPGSLALMFSNAPPFVEEFDQIHFHEKLTAPMKVLEKLGPITAVIN